MEMGLNELQGDSAKMTDNTYEYIMNIYMFCCLFIWQLVYLFICLSVYLPMCLLFPNKPNRIRE